MKRSYIVYKVTNKFDGKFYIGCHSTFNTNDRYMGSGTEIKEVLKKYGRKSFVKEMLFEYDSKKEMLAKEKELVTKEFCMRADTYNRIEGGGTYLTEGMVSVKDKDGNTSKVYCDDPRYLSGELVGVTKGNSHPNRSILNKGKVIVKDELGNIFKVFKDDPRYLSGELVSMMKGLPQHVNFSWLEKKHSDDTKQKMSEKANERIGEKNSMFGRKRSEEFKNGLKEKLSKDFFVYDKDGKFVSKQKNIKEYALLNDFNPSSIVKVLKGKYKHSNGFRFFYKFQGDNLS